MMACSLPVVNADAEGTADQVSVTGTRNYEYAYEVLEKVNEERAKEGLSALTMNESLLKTAMYRAEETSVYFSHTRPNGESCFTAFELGGTRGENIAAGQSTPTAVMTSWMNSEGHKANILGSSYKSIGIGCFESNGMIYWVQCFSSYSTSETFAEPSNVQNTATISFDSDTVTGGTLGMTATGLTVGGSTSPSVKWTNPGWSYAKVIINSDSLSWSSSDASVAVVDSNGKVTAVGVGTATITATTKDAVLNASTNITVSPKTVTGITLSQTTLSLTAGGSSTLTATVAPSDATNKTVSWTSSNTGVATVSNGKITAKKVGTATITCTANDGSGKTATCKVTVKAVKVTKITLSKKKVTLKKGKTIKLKVKKLIPANVTNKNVTWKSSNKKVATVDKNGKVKAVGKGTAIITCTAKDGSKVKSTCTVKVTK
jgi:uncharacterized protein YjdB